MGELAEALLPHNSMQERVDDILMANGGDARSAIEGLLLFMDGLSETISYGYVRGRYFLEQNLEE